MKLLRVLALYPVALVACQTDAVTTTNQAQTLCDPARCDGPNPYGQPNYLCADGETYAGPACVAGLATTSAEACQWGIVECPPDASACRTDECGPAPGIPNWTCDDGTLGGPACQRDAAGTCAWQIIECAEPPVCDWSDCPDPAPGAPNFLCADGVTIGGPACSPTPDGACGWTFMECPSCGDEPQPHS